MNRVLPVILLAMTVLTSALWAEDKDAAVPLEIFGVLRWEPQHKSANNYVFENADQMTPVWVADGGKKTALPRDFDEIGEIKVFDKEHKEDGPRVDFRKHMVVAVFGGEKPSGGFSVKVEKVIYHPNEKNATVIYSETAPTGNATAMLTYPHHVVVVKKAKIEGEPKFVKAGSAEARQAEESAAAAGKKDDKKKDKKKDKKEVGESQDK